LSILGDRRFESVSLLRGVWTNPSNRASGATISVYEGAAIYSQTRQGSFAAAVALAIVVDLIASRA
jgi:hypothetical protein